MMLYRSNIVQIFKSFWKKFNVNSAMAASDVSDVSVALSGQGYPPSCSAPCNVDAVNVSNPWPYLVSYRKYLGTKGNDNILVFQCLLCLPTVKKFLRTSNRNSSKAYWCNASP